MNWIKEAENDLRSHQKRIAATDNLQKQIDILEEEFTSLKEMSGATPVMGGASKQEDGMINNIVKRERLSMSLEITENLVALVRDALDSLSEKDRKILDLFYINRPSDYKDRLLEYLNVEEAQLYRLKNIALKNFTTAMYGIIEI